MNIFYADTTADAQAVNENFQGLADGSLVEEGAITAGKWTNPYCFRAWRSTAFNVTGSGGLEKINLQSVSFDPNGDYDNTTNYRYDVPVDGIYYFGTSWGLTNVDTAGVMILYILKNGISICRQQVYSSASTQDIFQHLATLSQCEAGDYIEMGIDCTTTESVVADEKSTYLEGFLIHKL